MFVVRGFDIVTRRQNRYSPFAVIDFETVTRSDTGSFVTQCERVNVALYREPITNVFVCFRIFRPGWLELSYRIRMLLVLFLLLLLWMTGMIVSIAVGS